ncbi:alcohol dehydrogenase catalytic domain-containing protein [Candidatus Binatia bacterium]|nr:alcohol dehydrogenase catalytic domain-containing protein [Candidatus Binatia bacterium]
MLAAFCDAPGRLDVRQVVEPVPGPGEVVVRVRSCGICGSDLHFFHGALPPPSVCPGHEISGEVYEVGQGAALRPGDRVAVEPLVVCRECVYCRTGDYQLCRHFQILGAMVDGGFAEFVRVPAYAAFPLPAGVDCEVGALTEPLAVTVHAVRLAPVRFGHRVLILGGGTIGLLAVAAARAAGAAEVWATVRHSHQAGAAVAMGASRVFTDPADATALAAATTEHPVDVVIETVGGAADTINEAVQHVRPGGTVAVLGVFSTMPSLNALFLLMKEVRIVGSLTYGRPDPRADFEIALHLLGAEPERYRKLITHRVPLRDIARGFALAGDKRAGSIKVSVTPD